MARIVKSLQIDGEVVEVRRDDISERFAAAAMQCPSVAIDSETTGLDWRHAELSLVQVRVPGLGTEIVQLRPTSQSSNLVRLVGSPATLKIFHHAVFDLGFMYDRWSCDIERVACTKVAAKLLWPDQQDLHSLRSLSQSLLGVQVDKSQQVSDWSLAKLRLEQVKYAAADVRHLHDLYKAVEVLLREAGRLNLAEGCWAHLPYRVRLEHLEIPDPFLY